VSNNLYTLPKTLDINPAIQIGVKGRQKELAEYVRGQMEAQNIKPRDVQKRARGAISHQTVWNILNERVRDIKSATLAGLAKGLRRPLEEVQAAAFGKLDTDPQVREVLLLKFYRGLPADRQEEVLEFVGLWFHRYGSEPPEDGDARPGKK
jgi:hypothetical protein